MRFLSFGLLVLVAAYLLVQGRLHERSGEKPVFLRTDAIALAHQVKMEVGVHSLFRPDSAQLSVLKKDYAALWAHLNHLYQTNDVEAGKEYYTEEWFRQLVRHNAATAAGVRRTDLAHRLHIQNWADDGLVCAATDTVVLQYHTPNAPPKTVQANLALVLLFQGDHWRLDALRVVSTTNRNW